MKRSFFWLICLTAGVAAAGTFALSAKAQDETSAIIATFDVVGEQFRVRIENPATIEQVRALERGESSATIPNGRLRRGAEGNEPWSWHLDPQEIELSEITIELCDGRPSFVEADLDYWVGTVGWFCPWSAVLVDVEEVGAPEPSPTSTPEPSPTSTPDPSPTPIPSPTSTPPVGLPETGDGLPAGDSTALGLFAALAVAGAALAGVGLLLARRTGQRFKFRTLVMLSGTRPKSS